MGIVLDWLWCGVRERVANFFLGGMCARCGTMRLRSFHAN